MIHYMIRWLSMAWGAFLPHLKEGDSCGGPVDGKESSAGLTAKINKLSGKTNRIEAAFHDFCGSSDAGAVAAAAVKIDDLLKIAKIVI